MLPVLLAHLRVLRQGPGRPRTRPAALAGDKAYSSRGTRAMLRSRGIRAVIPEPSDQQRPAATAALPVDVRSPTTGRPTAAVTSSNEPSTSSSSGAA